MAGCAHDTYLVPWEILLAKQNLVLLCENPDQYASKAFRILKFLLFPSYLPSLEKGKKRLRSEDKG
ncbi:hypothetical protein ColLi_01409 [Colletotrichum liriopes]|uniref:Uncharacterized protein n=1 Tax=Colletotrichum liriopes TaxID=708192 RepID=A0AA37GCV3_9PEZI|nr:hypothetical protein ColLi_01409 [Colletotrichum liriopes]